MKKISVKRQIFNWLTDFLTDEHYFQLLHLIQIGAIPNISDPKSLNEKVLWRMVYDKKDIFTHLTDKVGMRNYVIKVGLGKYLPAAFYIGNKPHEIPFGDFPSSFVVKPNHASGHVIFVDERHSLDRDKIIRKCDEWLNFSYYGRGREWPYKSINAKIIVEEHLGDNATLPVYKFYCFRGITKLILVGKGYFTKNKKNAAYNAEWQKLEIAAPLNRLEDFPPPLNLDKMLGLSRLLGIPFDFVRLDLYSTSEKIFIGEMTFTPAAGADKYLGIQNERLGQFWRIKAD